MLHMLEELSLRYETATAERILCVGFSTISRSLDILLLTALRNSIQMKKHVDPFVISTTRRKRKTRLLTWLNSMALKKMTANPKKFKTIAARVALVKMKALLSASSLLPKISKEQ